MDVFSGTEKKDIRLAHWLEDLGIEGLFLNMGPSFLIFVKAQ